VDIFPTLLDLCGLPELRVTDGTSFRSLLESPGSSWDEVAYHVFNRRREIDGKMRLIIGHSIRTERYRYVRWHLDWNIGARVVGEELYDYEVDPHETRNVVGNGDYLDISKELESRLRLHVSQYSAD
jgi:arylsulfatase A-like enzyme